MADRPSGGPPGSGWICLVYDELPAGGILEVSLGDEDLVVWRGESGVPCVSEARCPHQWSHLAHQGAVDGDELVCLTHFWRFGADGAGWKQNVNGRRDRKGDLAVLACVEHDGAIWVRDPDEADSSGA